MVGKNIPNTRKIRAETPCQTEIQPRLGLFPGIASSPRYPFSADVRTRSADLGDMEGENASAVVNVILMA